jgi:alpha-beta hydrolase superfamily lysophospholipase
MQYVRETIDFDDNIFALHRWIPDTNQFNGMIQIIHGMAEHIKRYEEFAEYFTNKGLIVFGIDNLGHGETVSLNNGEYGYFAKEDGWIKVVNSNKYAAKLMKDRYNDLKLVVFGHSMGSIITRYYLVGDKITDGIIISGIMEYQEILMEVVKLLAKLEKALKEDKSENVIDNYLLDLIYNRKFNKNVNNNWLSSIKEEIEKYNSDEQCGFKLKNQMFIDMLEGLKTIDKKEKNREISKDIPLLIIGGSEDPVSNYGKDIKELFNKYKKLDFKDLKYKIYSNLRHEVIRDKRKDDVYSDLNQWIFNHI